MFIKCIEKLSLYIVNIAADAICHYNAMYGT